MSVYIVTILEIHYYSIDDSYRNMFISCALERMAISELHVIILN